MQSIIIKADIESAHEPEYELNKVFKEYCE